MKRERRSRTPLRRLLANAALVLVVIGGATEPRPGRSQPDQADEPERISEAAEAVRTGDVTAALAALDGLGSARAHYLRGRLLAREQRHAEAARAFAAADADDLPDAIQADLAERHAVALAHVHDDGGRCGEARPPLEAADTPRTRALAGECALRAGEHERAIRLLRAAAREDAAGIDTFAVRYELAEAHLALGQTAAARRELETLYTKHAAHPDAGRALALLEANGGPPRLSEEERLTRAEALLDAHRAEEAAAELGGRPPFNRVRRGRWLHLRGMALFKTRTRYAEAAQVLKQAARVGGPTELSDAFHAARALSRADQDLAAIRAYRRFARQHPRSRWAARAEFLAAWLEIRLGRFGGERRMEAFLEGPRAGLIPDLREDATWQLGLAAFEDERWARAAGLFARYARLGEGPMEKGRAQYWRGRALEKADQAEQAKEAYRAARAVDPLHYYGVLAARRLEGLGVDEPIPLGDPGPAPEEMSIRLADAVRFYTRLGLDADAAQALRRSEGELRRQAPEGRVNETLVRAHLMAGSHARAYRLAALERDRLRQRAEGDAQWAWEGAYPRPVFDTVVREARRRGLPWSLVYAIMRQESGYDADAVSGAGAIGLLQVMPEVGEGLGGDGFGVDQLFVPEQNVRLGIAELAGAVERMDGSIPLAIAAYNAGHARVDRWRRETGPVDFDLWVEKISFDETRNYVRRVLSHFARYRFIATGEATLPLPERVLPREATDTAPDPG